MGRPRDYDEDSVLSGAMHAFRRHGYEGASIRDLEAATGLKVGSIYNSFGDKAGLFDAAFAHYIQAVLRRRIDKFASPERGVEGVRKLFLSLLQEPNQEALGCLITNSAVELGGSGKGHPCVGQGLRILETTFLERLESARQNGTLPSSINTAVTATLLLALYQGVIVLVRGGHSAAALKRLINRVFDDLQRRSARP